MSKQISHDEFACHLNQFLSEEEVTELIRGPHIYEAVCRPVGMDGLLLHTKLLQECVNSGQVSKSYDLLMALWQSLAGPILVSSDVDELYVSIQKTALEICLSGCSVVVKCELQRVLVSGQINCVRLCVNILFVLMLLQKHDSVFLYSMSGLENSLVTALQGGRVPFGKLVVLLSLFYPIPFLILSPTSEPLDTLLTSFPLSQPNLSDFRSFVALATHQHTELINWWPPVGVFPRPAAIDEGIAIADRFMREFIKSYVFSDAELQLLRKDESLARPLELILEKEFFTKKICSKNDSAVISILLKILLSLCRGATSPCEPRPDCALDVVSNAILGILLASLDAGCIVRNNGCLVLLKIITGVSEDSSEIFKDPFPCVFPQLVLPAVTCVKALVVYRALLLLYKLCEPDPARIKKFLVHYKVAVVLKRFFTCPNADILHLAYRLFKIQIRYMSRKWKFMHIKLISSCYAAVETGPMDDWLTSDEESSSEPASPEERSTESPSSYESDLHALDFASESEIRKFCLKHGENEALFLSPTLALTSS